MKLGFAILTHKPPDPLFESLLTFLKGFPESIIAVHHDYHKCDFPERIIQKYNLQMVHPYYETKWGHVSKIPAILDTMKKVLSAEPAIDWLISVSANCYPIKSRSYILDFFENAKVDYFMDNKPLGLQYEGIYKWHYQALFTKRIGQIPSFDRKGKFKWRHIRIPVDRKATPFNDNMYPYAGSDWYFLNRKTVQRIIDADLSNHPMTHYVKKANEAPDKNASPDEIILQTFIRNQKDLIGNDDYHRYIDWENAKDWHPNTLTVRDWEAIKNSKALFARKFEWSQSEELINLINNNILKINQNL